MTSPDTRGRRRSEALRPASLLAYLVLVVGAVLTLAPFLLSFLTALKTPRQFASQSPLAWPDPVTGENFAELFGGGGFISPVVVTAQVVVVVVVGQLVFSIMAAYAFAWLRFPGRDGLFWLFLATLMVPQVVTVVPLYTMFSAVGLSNTFWALVLPFVLGSPYAVFLLREYFRGIPADLLDAARIDGAGTWTILWRVVVPLARPIVATLGIITVVTHWNTFLWPLIITTGPTWQTVTVATAALQSQYDSNWTLVMAATTVAIAPLLVVFAVFQRHIVSSISLTGFR
ncbi:carbohydrate ABC transporter permease [Desertihabitans brevis]|uniref:Carbohydrate ABC transporter permease n=1 Tax=Desertihabitans brevis TaxID=2268447 RepID=A0A367YUW6_9ACTN|nr:carbohydrate ABC transporter permease [Desertihabitans brevis]RCK69329.1 carbohydrate ABC transporter permease [Desertihabitans brevis]